MKGKKLLILNSCFVELFVLLKITCKRRHILVIVKITHTHTHTHPKKEEKSKKKKKKEKLASSSESPLNEEENAHLLLQALKSLVKLKIFMLMKLKIYNINGRGSVKN